MSYYLTRAQSTIDEVRLILEGTDHKSTLEMLHRLYMIYVLHGLHKNFELVRNQILTNLNIPIVENLIEWLVQVPSTIATFDGATLAIGDLFAFFTCFDDHG